MLVRANMSGGGGGSNIYKNQIASLSTTEQTVTVGFKPTCVVVNTYYGNNHSAAYLWQFIFDFINNKIYATNPTSPMIDMQDYTSQNFITAEPTSTGFKIKLINGSFMCTNINYIAVG